jgi:hypothetical protein
VQSATLADVAAQLAREEAPGRSETGVPNDVHDGGPSTMTIRQIVARMGAGGSVGVITDTPYIVWHIMPRRLTQGSCAGRSH